MKASILRDLYALAADSDSVYFVATGVKDVRVSMPTIGQMCFKNHIVCRQTSSVWPGRALSALTDMLYDREELVAFHGEPTKRSSGSAAGRSGTGPYPPAAPEGPAGDNIRPLLFPTTRLAGGSPLGPAPLWRPRRIGVMSGTSWSCPRRNGAGFGHISRRTKRSGS